MKFINTKRLSPVIYEGDVPHDLDMYWEDPANIPTTKREYEKFLKKFVIDRAWWDRQRTRCKNGYIVPNAVSFDGGEIFIDGVNVFHTENGGRYLPHLGITINPQGDLYITGRNYFYLNFWAISREDRMQQKKTLGNPYFTDLSWENWMIRERSKMINKDIGWFKCRQKGLSEEEAADTAWIFLFMNDVQVAIVGGLDQYNQNTFSMVKRGIYNLYNTQFYKEIKLDNPDVLKAANTGTEIHSRTAKNNSQVLSGLNMLYKVHMEEIGIMKENLSREIAQFVYPSIRTQGRRTGFIVYTGTSGKYVDGVADIEKMIYTPEKYELYSIKNIYDTDADPDMEIACFIPAWKFKLIDDDGNSLKKEALELIDRERKSKSPSERALLIAMEPIDTREMFNIVLGGFFGEEISYHCSQARSNIVTHKRLQRVERGFLHYKDRRKPWEGVEWEFNMDKGDIAIAEHPQIDDNNKTIEGLYGQGTDSYDFDEAMTSSSKLASLVYKGYNKNLTVKENQVFNTFVAMYLDRPGEAQGGRTTAYENAAKLSIYYRTYNMIEYSKILIFDYYELYGLEGFLHSRPDWYIAQYVERSQVSNKYGFPASLVPSGLTRLKDYLLDVINIYNCPFEELLMAWAKFRRDPKYNCDLTIASMLCIAMVENTAIEQKAVELRRPEIEFKGYVERNGIIVPTHI